MPRTALKPSVVSIVMPTYNAESHVSDAIDSIVNQSFTDWELIVIDDASEDSTVQIVESFISEDDRIRLHVMSENSGSPSRPRSWGVINSVGRYITFLDADDLWLPEKLNYQIEFMTKHKPAVICSAYVAQKSNGFFRYKPKFAISYSDLLRENHIGCLTALYDSELVGRREFPTCGHEDYALWLELSREGYEFRGLDEVLAVYRVFGDSVSSNKVKVLSFFWNIYRYRENFGLIQSAYCVFRYAYNARNRYSQKLEFKIPGLLKKN